MRRFGRVRGRAAGAVLVASCIGPLACDGGETATAEGHTAAAGSTEIGAAPAGVSAAVAAGADVARASTAAERSEAAAHRRDSLVERTRRLREQLAGLPRPLRSPAEIGAALGGDPDAVLGFVRGAVRYEPYAGILRGPAGTLAAGGGNSADVALLLDALLEGSDAVEATRFVIAELDEPAARALVERAVASGPSRAARLWTSGPPAPSFAASSTGPADRGSASGAPHPEVRYRRELDGRLQATAAALAPHLPPSSGEALNDAVSAARTHVRLEIRRTASDAWEPLDPLPAELPEGAPARIVPELPPGWNHRVMLGLDVERLEGERLAEESVLRAEWTASELYGRPVHVTVVPEGFDAWSLLDSAPGSTPLLDQARSFDRFATFVTGGGSSGPEAGRHFDLEGRTRAPGDPWGFGDLDPFARVGALLGRDEDSTRGEAGARGASTPDTELTAVWLTLTLHEPGRAPAILRRALVDRIGPGVRASGSPPTDLGDPLAVRLQLVQSVQILVAPGRIGFDLPASEALRAISGAAVTDAVRTESVTAERLRRALDEPSLPALPADLVGVSDGALARAEREIEGRGIAYLGRPNVHLRGERLGLGEDGRITARVEIDILRAEVSALGDPAGAARARLLHGIAASELEGRRAERSAAAALRELAARGVAFRTITDEEELSALSLRADVHAVLASRLRAGRIARVPETGLDTPGGSYHPWWEMDRTGNVLAVGPGGAGQAVSEGVLVLEKISIPMVRRSMRFVACLNEAVAGGASTRDAGGACMKDVVVDIVKTSLDAAISQFVVDPMKSRYGDWIDDRLAGARYQELYDRAKEAWEAYQSARDTGTDALESGAAAADAGARIGSVMGFRLYLLLTMGAEIATYAASL